jgi:hypothetical protein
MMPRDAAQQAPPPTDPAARRETFLQSLRRECERRLRGALRSRAGSDLEHAAAQARARSSQSGAARRRTARPKGAR